MKKACLVIVFLMFAVAAVAQDAPKTDYKLMWLKSEKARAELIVNRLKGQLKEAEGYLELVTKQVENYQVPEEPAEVEEAPASE